MGYNVPSEWVLGPFGNGDGQATSPPDQFTAPLLLLGCFAFLNSGFLSHPGVQPPSSHGVLSRPAPRRRLLLAAPLLLSQPPRALPPRAEDPASIPYRAWDSSLPSRATAASAPRLRRGGSGGPPGRSRRRLPSVAPDVEVLCGQQSRHLRRRVARAPLRPLRLRLRRRLPPRHPRVARVRGPGVPRRRRLLRRGESIRSGRYCINDWVK
jgi:hypothetical protein